MKKNSYKTKCQDEAEATIRKNRGRYCDLFKTSLVRKGKNLLTDSQFKNLLKKIRLRFCLTPKCNLWCIFCSNEGASYHAKCQEHANIDLIIKLSEMVIKNTPIKSIDFSGGEPTLHPDFLGKKFKLIKWTKKHPNIRFALHSNGIELNPYVIDKIKNNFSRIGISVNSFNFPTWEKMTNLKKIYPLDVQKIKFKKLISNLNYISRQKIGYKVFVKSVIMKGFNDSEEEIKNFLDKCNEYKFHPKFFQFEPQYPEQYKYVVGREVFFKKLKKIGCKLSCSSEEYSNNNKYIPSINFTYKDTPPGVHSFFGCGLVNACESCYDFACIFIKPDKTGQRLYLKPCLALDTVIDLTHSIKRNDYKQLIKLIKISREYLMTAPGVGVMGWNKEDEFNCF